MQCIDASKRMDQPAPTQPGSDEPSPGSFVTLSLTVDIINPDGSTLTHDRVVLQIAPHLVGEFLSQLVQTARGVAPDNYRETARYQRRLGTGSHILTVSMAPKPKTPPPLPAGDNTFQERYQNKK